jgi:hypothetical protein
VPGYHTVPQAGAQYNCTHTGNVIEMQHTFVSDDHGITWAIAGAPGQQQYGFGSAEGAIVGLYDNPKHVLAVMRVDEGTRNCTGPHSSKGNVTSCRMVAESFDGGDSFNNVHQLADLPDPGTQGALTQWPAGRGIIASSPNNGGCRAGCNEYCNWHGSGKAIDAGWEIICKSGICCPEGNNTLPANLWCPGGGNGRCNLTVFMSTDEGQSFPHTKNLCEGQEQWCDAGYSALAMVDSDTIGVVWEQHCDLAFATLDVRQLANTVRWQQPPRKTDDDESPAPPSPPQRQSVYLTKLMSTAGGEGKEFMKGDDTLRWPNNPSRKLDDAAAAITTLHVAADGSDSLGTGTAAAPLASCKAAVSKLAAACGGGGPCTVRFGPGMYALNSSTACGAVNWNGSAARPLVFAGDPAGGTHFDAMALLDPTQLSPVTEPRIVKLINPAARGKLLVMPLPGEPSTLEWGGVPMHSSVWPNPQVGTGVAYVRKVLDRGSYYYPGRSNWSVPHPHICIGDNKSTIAHPCGGNISLAEQPTGDWRAEMAAGPGFGAVKVTGYLANDWERLTLTVARVEQSKTNTSLQFAEYTPYGICEAMEGGHKSLVNHCGGPAPGRFTVAGFLSEVNVPGEWFYDHAAHQLYIYPPYPADGGHWSPAALKTVRFGHWQGPGLISTASSSYLTLRDVTISGVGGGTVVALSGDHNTVGGPPSRFRPRNCFWGPRNIHYGEHWRLPMENISWMCSGCVPDSAQITFLGSESRAQVGGCTLKNSAGMAVSVGGTHNRMLGNDVYDVVKGAVSTAGGGDMKRLGPATNNLIQNNHFTQVYLRGIAWGISLKGMGDRFSHNLVHDSPGQMLTPGMMQMIDGNEIFNTGYVEGDGGVIYSGASLVSGYGMQYRENFVHHSLEVPGLHGGFSIKFCPCACAVCRNGDTSVLKTRTVTTSYTIRSWWHLF